MPLFTRLPHAEATLDAMETLIDSPRYRPATNDWNAVDCDSLIDELRLLRRAMMAHEKTLAPWIAEAGHERAASARNLAHYLALRGTDLRDIQDRLARLGVSSLGRSESHVLANLDKVLGLLHVLSGLSWEAKSADEPIGFGSGRARLAANARALLGPEPPGRDVRIMVTLPGGAGRDAALIGALIDAGMDVARINCAHDEPADWSAAAGEVRRAAAARGREVKVLMDLGGPKIRTGPIVAGPAVLKIKPRRDELGRITRPGLLGLRPAGSGIPVPGADAIVDVDPEWLAQLHKGDRIELVDARDAERRLEVVDEQIGWALAECTKTAYLTSSTRLRLRGRKPRHADTPIGALPAPVARLRLARGDLLRLVADGIGRPADAKERERLAISAIVSCTLPAVLNQVRKAERVWFDDGRIGGVIRRVANGRVDVEITDIAEDGEYLQADKGINLPDSSLELPALTAKDREDLDVVARHADLVGLSFAQGADDVRTLIAELAMRSASRIGLMLKIETRRGFEHLPEILFAAMQANVAGVMIARGDLAVECGFERLAEVQEEILWACEAAHMPVVWATQVLETLAKKGHVSRAEITDAAMGERAECVMLNKGPHILGAMHTLDDVLRRMQGHHSKKRSQMRALRAWKLAGGTERVN